MACLQVVCACLTDRLSKPNAAMQILTLTFNAASTLTSPHQLTPTEPLNLIKRSSPNHNPNAHPNCNLKPNPNETPTLNTPTKLLSLLTKLLKAY